MIEPLVRTTRASPAHENGAQVYLVADFLKRYPGELVRLTTYVLPGKAWQGGEVSVFLPEGMELVDYSPLQGENVQWVVVQDLEEGTRLNWCLEQLPVEERIELAAVARLKDPGFNAYLTAQAQMRDAAGFEIAAESVQIAVRSTSQYMQYLPEIYHGSDLMNRLLMLFESFWQPLDRQISQPEHYFDPRLAPPNFLPWLASWIGVPVDEAIPEERKRELLHSALSLYQRFGTRSALEEFLRMYTGGSVEIIEHRAQNFIVGPAACLGSTIALGKKNFPNTFTVQVTVPRQEVQRIFGKELANREKLFRSRVEAIIDAQKPAHTAYLLNLRFTD